MNLLNLIGQVAGAQVAPDDYQGQIVVPGTVPQPSVSQPVPDLYEDFSLNNSDAIREREAALADGAEAAEHKGMFGVKGTLRDVLGLVGDAFLVQSGNKSIYDQHRLQEQAGDAMAGMSRDPIAAAERMTGVNPQAAAQLLEQAQAHAQKQAALQINAAKAQNTIGKDAASVYNKGSEVYGRYAGVANSENWPQMRQVLLKIQNNAGLGPEFNPPEVFDPNWAKAMQMGGMPTSRQVSSEQRDTQLGIGQQNADANTKRANREPRAPAPKNPTEASEITRIRGKLNRGENLSTGDKQTWDRYINGTSRSGRGGRRSVPNTAATPSGSRFGPPRN